MKRYKLYEVGPGSLKTVHYMSNFYESERDLFDAMIANILTYPKRLESVKRSNKQYAIQQYNDKYEAEIIQIFRFSNVHLNETQTEFIFGPYF
jgi:hypothetical protein